MKRTLQRLAVLMLVVGLAGAAEARMHGGKMVMSGEKGHFAHQLAALDLTEAQQEAFRELHANLKKEVIRKKADVGVAEIELQEIIDSDPMDLDAAEAKIHLIASSRADIRVLHLKASETFRSQLTPEQQSKFDELADSRFLGMGMEKGPGDMGMGKGPHGMMGGGRQGMMGGGGCPMMKGMGHGSPPAGGTPAADQEPKAPTDPGAHNH